MKVRFSLIAAAVLIGGLVAPGEGVAQFAAGQKYVGAHIGLSGVGTSAAFGVSGEVAIDKNITVGGWADTWSYGESYTVAQARTSWDIRYIAVAGTGAYHFSIPSSPRVDPFVGLALGYFVVSSEVRGPGGSVFPGDASRIFLGGFGGARYFFKDNLSGVARLGFGASYLTVGVDYKL